MCVDILKAVLFAEKSCDSVFDKNPRAAEQNPVFYVICNTNIFLTIRSAFMKKKLVMTISAVLLTAFLAGGTVSAASVNAGGKSGSAIAGLLTDYARRKYEEQKKAEEERQARVNEMKRMVPVLLTEIKRDRDLKTYEEYYEKYKETFDKLISYGEEAIPLLEKSGGER